MKTATSSDVRSHLNDFLNGSEPVVVTQNGHPKAVLVPVEDGEAVERLLMANNAELMKILDQADASISKNGGIPHDEFWARAKKLAKTRKRGGR